jgi:large exoprotein involved in heme utilization and adhesion
MIADTIHVVNSPNIKTDTSGAAPAGSIAFKATTFLADGTTKISSSSSASGPGGNISITTGQSVTLNNGGSITASSSGPGNAGTVTVQGLPGSASAVLINGSGSGIHTDTTGTGAGGSIVVNANSVTLQNGGTVSSTATQATGGDINILAGQSVTLSNGASISASSTGAGNAGAIMINAGNQFVMANSSVTTQASQASGGTIKITTAPNGTVELSNSTISASVLDGTGGGGSVNIDPQFVLLQNSQILANAVQGPGGNISITSNVFLPDANSVVSASSQFGVNGTVAIQSPINPAGGRIIPLSQKPLTATALLSQRCAALASGELSSFTVAGRDSLPAEPGDWLGSPLALTMLSGGTGLEARGEGLVQEASPASETPLLSLRQIAPPGFLTQAFAVDWSAGCTS